MEKLTDNEVEQIRKMADQELSYKEIASCFDIHRTTVGKIVRGDLRNSSERGFKPSKKLSELLDR